VSRIWYRDNPCLYGQVRKAIEDSFSELRFVERGSDILLVGLYVLCEGTQVLDRYLIEVEVDKVSPTGLPTVREIDGRIPRVVDRHMESDGKACIVLPDAYWYEHPDGMSLLEFLNGPVRSFFASQSLIEVGATDPWPAGEWGHGFLGTLEFYEKILGTKNPEIISQFLSLMKRDTIKGHWLCPCGSGDKLRKCHRSLVEQLRTRIPRQVAARSEEIILKSLRQLAAHALESTS
jgi:hypothetical protein